MFQFSFIKGASLGLEYFDSQIFGFGLNLDLGILRVTWYKDVHIVEAEQEDEEEE
jgi:hypothetical protein